MPARLVKGKELVMLKKAWRLIFGVGHLPIYLKGEEVLTFRIHRPGSNDFQKNQIIEGHFMEGIMLLLEVVDEPVVKRFSDITHKECKEWARLTHDDMTHAGMMRIMREYHSDLTHDTVAVIIRLRLVHVDGRPIAGALPEGL